MTVNDGQNIVKIMRDPAGELADGFHFLRLPQLIFQFAHSRFRESCGRLHPWS